MNPWFKTPRKKDSVCVCGMYALRVYKSNPEGTNHTNTVYGTFEERDENVHMFVYKDKKLDWKLSKFGVWPANDRKKTLYPLPDGKRLHLFSKSKDNDNVKLLASVAEPDNYIRFIPPSDNETFYLVVAHDEDEAKIKI